jgi:hypothetical protein
MSARAQVKSREPGTRRAIHGVKTASHKQHLPQSVVRQQRDLIYIFESE